MYLSTYIHVCMCMVCMTAWVGALAALWQASWAVCLLLTRPGKMQVALSNRGWDVVGGCRDLFLSKVLDYLLLLFG